jgi:hypothetical protein
MATEDPEGGRISSVLAQEGLEAAYSGASVIAATGDTVVEGVAGTGEGFMQGRVPPQPLPQKIVVDIQSIHRVAAERLGPVRFEWVHDGTTAWVIQLHRGATPTAGRVIYPGEPAFEHRFQVEEGLEALRALIEQLEGTGEGVVLVGRVGVTSHLGDVLRRARIPSRLEMPATTSDTED